jgi:hypothetical protein
MKKIVIPLLALMVAVCYTACLKDKDNSQTAQVAALQSKVNVGHAFIVPDSRADKTNQPFTTLSDMRQRITDYWQSTPPKLALNDNLFAIDDLLKLFGDKEKIVFTVEGIAEKQLKIQAVAYNAVKDKFADADKGTTYYYVVDKAALTRKMPSDADPDGMMYAKTESGELVTHLSVNIGLGKKGSQIRHSLILQAIKYDENAMKSLEVRGDPPGSGLEIPPPR